MIYVFPIWCDQQQNTLAKHIQIIIKTNIENKGVKARSTWWSTSYICIDFSWIKKLFYINGSITKLTVQSWTR